MRPDDIPNLPGSELVGFMPRRGDFDVECENSAEEAIADMEFIPGESEQDRQLKLQVLVIYNSKLDEREKRKKFVLSRKLYDYRQYQREYQQLPRDERDLVHRMRLFERFHTPAEHKLFIADLLKAKRLRKEIAKLQMYRRMGIRTLVEAERYELDKARRLFHKNALQNESEAKRVEGSVDTGGASYDARAGGSAMDDSDSSLYWKQYRTTDRKVRRSVNRGVLPAEDNKVEASSEHPTVDRASAPPSDEMPTVNGSETKTDEAATDNTAGIDAMDADSHKEQSEASPEDANVSEAPATMDGDVKDSPTAEHNEKEDLSRFTGYNLLSAREVDLCKSVHLKPAQYLEIKKALIHESLMQGLLDDNLTANNKHRSNVSGKFAKKLGAGAQRTLVKIDVERRGAVIDFVARAGWISTQFGKAVRDGL
jgi:hypothetical protein